MNEFLIVRAAIAKFCGVPECAIGRLDTLADLGVDSLAMAEMLFEIEEKYGVTIPEPEVRPVTVEDLEKIIAPLALSQRDS